MHSVRGLQEVPPVGDDDAETWHLWGPQSRACPLSHVPASAPS